MSASLIIGIIFLLICVLYGWVRSAYTPENDLVIGVEAGDEDSDCHFVESYRPSKSVRLENGMYINTHDYIRVVICGSCMKPRNILNGEEWLVEPFDRSKPIKEQVKIRDIVLFYIEDKELNIIRQVDSVEEDGSFITSSYDDNGERHQSKRNHRPEQARGVVRYAI